MGIFFNKKAAFTLIEVVISVGVVALALISVLGLIIVFQEGTKNVVDQEEVHSVCQILNSTLQKNGLATVYSWIQNSNVPPLYAYSITVDPTGKPVPAGTTGGVPQLQIVDASSGAAALTNVDNRVGRLFFIALSLAPNIAIHTGIQRSVNATPASGNIVNVSLFPTGSGDTTFFAESALSLSVRIYQVSAYNANFTSGNCLVALDQNLKKYPIIIYDTTVSR